MKACNNFLEIENSAYRFIDGKVAGISSAEEIEEIETAIKSSNLYYGVKEHLGRSISLMSDRSTPDYRNSIKESISAVESLCKSFSTRHHVTSVGCRAIFRCAQKLPQSAALYA
jgi:hypothetical protein